MSSSRDAPASGGQAELLGLWARLDAPERARLLEQARSMVRSARPVAGPVMDAPPRRRRWLAVALVLAIAGAVFGLKFAGYPRLMETIEAKFAAVRGEWSSWSREPAAIEPIPAPRKQRQWE